MARNGSNLIDILIASGFGLGGFLIGLFVKKEYDSNTDTMEKSLGKTQWNLPDDKLDQIFSSKKK
ncbi:MAG: hypothetical protein NG784_05870 [Candidatus Jettenia sp.]|nr:hypothetical protein [Candidatus Jettenia sp.]